jgi:pseudaminic acid cytidylyltransferase
LSIFAVIPARGGSKRIPQKNIRPFHGKPVISFSIEVAKQSGLFDEVYVSTDDKEIEAIARQNGASIIARPQTLADDFTGTIPVIRHAIEVLSSHQPRYICCIYPASPFVSVSELAAGFEMIQEEDVDFVVPVCKLPSSVERSFRLGSDGAIEMCFPEHYESRTQDLKEAFFDADRFYWGSVDAWNSQDRIFTDTARGMPLRPDRVCVIDDLDDWGEAESRYRQQDSEATVKLSSQRENLDEVRAYLEVIDEIEHVRSKNNVNWMDILRLAFIHAPDEAQEVMARINRDDAKVGSLVEKLKG